MAVDWVTVIPKYLDYLLYERDQSVYKIHSYKKWLTYFSRTIPFPFTLSEMRAFLILQKKRQSPATVNYLITMVNSFIRWCQLEKLSQEDFSKELNSLRPHEDRTPDANDCLSLEEIQVLIKNPVRDLKYLNVGNIGNIIKDLPAYYEKMDTMYSLLFEMQYRLFARSGELLALRKKNFNFSNHSVTFYKTKTGGDRTVAIPPQMEQRILDFISPLNDTDYLFCRSRKTPITQEMANKMFKTRGKLVGIKRSLHIHMLRHTGLTHMLANGCPTSMAMIIGGWKRLSTVELYTHLLVDQQRKALANYSPLVEKIEKKMLYQVVKEKIEELHLERLGIIPVLTVEHEHRINLTVDFS
jgi:site-specific recombinase XerD